MIQPGVYKHFRGGMYTVILIAQDSTNSRERPDGSKNHIVIYVSHTNGKVFARDLDEFIELVKWPAHRTPNEELRLHPRFMRWEERQPPGWMEKEIERLHKEADAAWERGDKKTSTDLHYEAHVLSERLKEKP